MSKLQAALQQVQSPKISMRELQQRQFKGATVQAAPVTETNYSGQMNALMEAGTKAVGMYDARREKEGIRKKNELMLKHLDRSELGKLRQSNALLYQDDPYAMRALDRELGRSEAYSVDAQVAANVESGLWNTRQKMEEGRAYLMQQSKKSMAETYGVDPSNNRYFMEGYESDITDRDFSLYNAVAKKESDEKKNLGFTSASSNVSDMAKAGVPFQDVATYLEQNGREGTGLITNDDNKEKLLMQYLSDISNSASGGALLDQALDTPVMLYDREVTMRQRIGAEGANALKLSSMENMFKLDKEQKKWLIGGLSYISNIDGTNPAASTMVRDKYAEMSKWLDEQEQTDMVSSARIQLEQVMVTAEQRIKDGNEKRTVALKKEYQSAERVRQILWRAEQRMNGNATPIDLASFTESSETGKFEANDYNLTFDEYRKSLSELPESEQIAAILKFGNAFPEGNAGVAAWKGAAMEAYNKETMQVNLAIQGGRDLPETPRRDAMREAYKADPDNFAMNFPEYAEETTEMAVIQDSGIDYATYYKGKMEWDKMPAEARMQRSAEIGAQLVKQSPNNVFNKLTPSEQTMYIKATMGTYGLKPNEALRTLTTALDRRFQTIGEGGNRGFIQKQLLQVDANDPDSVNKGKAGLEAYIASSFGENSKLVGVSSDSRGNIRIVHPVTGEKLLTKNGLIEWMKANKRL
ncbi:MAG: hypothetical protein ACRCW3_00145 [Metamycoplasmataceae bacterium]